MTKTTTTAHRNRPRAGTHKLHARFACDRLQHMVVRAGVDSCHRAGTVAGGYNAWRMSGMFEGRARTGRAMPLDGSPVGLGYVTRAEAKRS